MAKGNKMEPTQQSTRALTVVGGLLLLAMGVLAIHDLWHMPQERLLPTRLQAVMFFGPAFVAAGSLTLLYGVLSASLIFRRAVLALGLLMLVVGGLPWVYTPYITGNRQESAGMLGTCIFIYVGLPGIASTVAGMVLIARNRRKGKTDGQPSPAA